MNQKSLKKSFIYNTILRLVSIIFPLITFPYVARVLSPSGIGKIDFSMSVVQYFLLIAQLGIPTYAIRECAKFRDNKSVLTKTVQEILGINSIAVVFSYIFFLILIFSVDQLDSFRNILIIASLNIFTTSIGVEWFYQSIEEYKYITIRSIFVRILAFIAIFLFVKNENDIIIYAAITVISTSLGNFYNFLYLKKHIDIFKKMRNYNFTRHIKPIFLLFAMSLSVSVYTNLDKVMLGVLSSNMEVGLYTTANRLIIIILALVTSLGTVLLPRMSYYIEGKNTIQVKKLIEKSLNFILMISIPATTGLIILADPIIRVFAGEEFLKSITTLRIISPIIIMISLSHLIGIQILVSYGKEKITLLSTIFGAIINFSLNLLLIPLFKQNGAAFGTIIAELAVLMFQLVFAYSYIKDVVPWKSIATYLIGSMLIMAISGIIVNVSTNLLSSIILSILTSGIAYFGFIYLMKNDLLHEIINSILKK